MMAPQLRISSSFVTLRNHHFRFYSPRLLTISRPGTIRMASSAVVSTLRHVTGRKLEKIGEQQTNYDSQKSEILRHVAESSTPAEKLKALLTGFEKHNLPTPGISTSNMRKFVEQAQHDPTVSDTMLSGWVHQLTDVLRIGTRKYDFASLFGRLVTEWLGDNGRESAATNSQRNKSTTGQALNYLTDSDSGSDYQTVGRSEMHEQRRFWETHTFNERKLDQKAIQGYLRAIFEPSTSSKSQGNALKELRTSMKSFKIPTNPFSERILKSCIDGLLKTNHFEGQKREGLVNLKEQPTVLREIADILNMDLASLNSWEWKPAPVPIFMRRQLNGKYRVFMDEEIHQAILLHYIGSHFAIHLRQIFTKFYQEAWKRNSASVNNRGQRDRRLQFGIGNVPSVSQALVTHTGYRGHRFEGASDVRNAMYFEDFFMSHLPSKLFDGHGSYDDDSSDIRSKKSGTKSPGEIKQLLLRAATTEMLLSTKIHGEFTMWQSDFKWFGPSLSHDSIFAVLDYLGVESKWQDFFRSFLEAPLAFAQDGPEAEQRVRKCGIPMSHSLSEAFSEAVLFCLDFAVNQKTGGTNLYRFHDDLWFWGKETTCVDAWQTLNDFCTAMGLELNEEKTAAALIIGEGRPKRTMSPILPNGVLRWGFLTLDSGSATWTIDRDQVSKHIKEILLQLNACTSVFGWIQAWNSYVSRFLSTNFGQPANCFGRPHVNVLIETFKDVQVALFGPQGSAISHLRTLIRNRFDVSDIPDGFFYFPTSVGGLGLRNPFIPLFIILNSSLKEPSKRLDQALEMEERDYEILRERYESDEHSVSRRSEASRKENKPKEPFLSFKEYTSNQEQFSTPILHAYRDLLEVPKEENVDISESLTQGLQTDLRDSVDDKSLEFSQSIHNIVPYWKWVLQLYGSDVQKHFGGLTMCDRGMLPMGIVHILKSEKIQWLG